MATGFSLLTEQETSSQKPATSKFRVDTIDIRCYKNRSPDCGVNKKLKLRDEKKGF
jgi:hypothetical protein